MSIRLLSFLLHVRSPFVKNAAVKIRVTRHVYSAFSGCLKSSWIIMVCGGGCPATELIHKDLRRQQTCVCSDLQFTVLPPVCYYINITYNLWGARPLSVCLSVCWLYIIINTASKNIFWTCGRKQKPKSELHPVPVHLSARHVREGDFFIKAFETMKWSRYVCFFCPCSDFLSLLLISHSQPLWGPWTSVCCMTRRTMLCTAPLTKPRWAAAAAVVTPALTLVFQLSDQFKWDFLYEMTQPPSNMSKFVAPLFLKALQRSNCRGRIGFFCVFCFCFMR